MTAPDESQRLWLVSNYEEGTHAIVDTDGKKGRAGSSSSRDTPLHEVLARMVRQLEGHAAFWLEFGLEMASNPPLPGAGDKVHIVTPAFHAFTAFVEQTGGGFGGDRFDIVMLNGINFWSANVWGRGVVPLHMRKLLPPNANAIKGLRS